MKNILLLIAFLASGFFFALNGQQIIKVVDGVTGEPLPFALIERLGANQFYTTNVSGEANLGLPKVDNAVVLVSFLGYEDFQLDLGLDKSTILVTLSQQKLSLEEVLVTATRVGEQGVFATENIGKKSLNKQNLGQDLPILLDQATSVVTSTDAGVGIGYSGIRVRGSDPTRINITINGIPVNDAESQSVYWVNMPDLVSSLNSIQIQRGVGTSTNGAGAFGASINLQTDKLQKEAYLETNNSFGSFATRKNTIKVGTGLISDKWTADARWSNIQSNGYIDRASTKLGSLYVSAGGYFKNDVVKFIAFGGKEKTYQAWNGVSQDSLATNRTYNFTGEYYDAQGNRKYYKDEADNYWQDNYQLHWAHKQNEKLNYSLALHYTRGKGYYEQYRQQDKLESYGISNVSIGTETITISDLIRRRWLDNHFGGAVFSIAWNASPRLNSTLGGGINKYFGDHFGEVIWAQYASDKSKDHEYYRDNANKLDGNVYAKTQYEISKKWNAFLDLQLRSISYNFRGYNAQLVNVAQQAPFHFFNPKLGLFYKMDPLTDAFISFSIGNKEPNRNDFTDSSILTRPKKERLSDLEIGLHKRWAKSEVKITAYNMAYNNQLILTGKINDVGDYTRTNVPKSKRSGIELEAAIRPSQKINFSGNVTFSKNKISAFTEYLDTYDADYNYNGQKEISHIKTDIAFSPSVITGIALEYKMSQYLSIAYQSKYVGKQYLDNTMNNARSIEAYHVGTLRASGNIPTSWLKQVDWNVLINNVFNAKYSNNGYTYAYAVSNIREDYNYYFPQAGRNLIVGLNVSF